jgi:hypothetical protein
LRNVTALIGYLVLADDGSLGYVNDFLFSEKSWRLRHLVVGTGFNSVPWKEILIPLDALGEPDWAAQAFPVNLTHADMKTSPPIEKKPVAGKSADCQSAREVMGYATSASDAEVGKVDDFIVEDGTVDPVESWMIRYLLIDTASWRPGKKFLLPPAWIREIRWPQRQVTIPFTREAIDAPGLWRSD